MGFEWVEKMGVGGNSGGGERLCVMTEPLL
jgi:hypothetical protein